MSYTVLLVLALIAGAVIPIQAGINGIVGLRTQSPIWATTLNFIVGTLVLVGIVLVSGHMRAFRRAVFELPLWVWSGGVLGAFFVTITVYLAPRLGAANMLASVIAGQMVAALLLDQFGVLGYPVHQVSPQRVLGVLLLGASVWLIRR